MLTKQPISRKATQNSQGKPASLKWKRMPDGKALKPRLLGTKFFELGRLRQNSAAESMPMIPIAASAPRQDMKSLSTEVTIRPDMPPKALPDIYRPIDRPSEGGSISSPR